jgi:capsular polysaccharide transport system permease protein
MGYFWAIVEPSTQIAVFAAVKLLFFGSSMPGVDFAVFLASGFLVYNLFKNILSASMSAFDANQALFIYSQVKPIHAIFARILVEFLIFIFVSLFFLCIGWYFNFDINIKNLNMILLTVLWVIIFAFSLGLLFAVIGTFYETFKKVVNLIMSPLLFLSALFYTVEQLPPAVREIILYNPVAHFMELIHGSYIEVLDTKYVDYTYIMYWTIIPLFLGLYFYINSERKIVST